MDPKHQRQSIDWLKKGCDLGDKSSCAFLPRPAPRVMRPGEEPGPGLIGSLQAHP